MEKLFLNFLDKENVKDKAYSLLTLMEEYRKQIDNYAKDYLHAIVAHGSNEGNITDISLYIIAPEIKYDYRILSLEIIGADEIKISFYSLIMSKTRVEVVNFSDSSRKLEKIITEMLSGDSANSSLRFLIEQIYLKRSRQKMELQFDISSLKEIKKLCAITFDKDGKKINKTDFENKISDFIKSSPSREKLFVDFNFFPEEIIFLYIYRNSKKGNVILFCDKTSTQPYCIWETPEAYPEDSIEEISQKYLNYYLKRPYSSSPYMDFFNIARGLGESHL